MTLKKIVRKLTNDIRMLDHAACLAEGPLINMEKDFKRASKKLGIDNPFEDDIIELRATVKLFQEQADALHDKMAEAAFNNDVEVPFENVVNGGPAKPSR